MLNLLAKQFPFLMILSTGFFIYIDWLYTGMIVTLSIAFIVFLFLFWLIMYGTPENTKLRKKIYLIWSRWGITTTVSFLFYLGYGYSLGDYDFNEYSNIELFFLIGINILMILFGFYKDKVVKEY